jgi:hypothetical protein
MLQKITRRRVVVRSPIAPRSVRFGVRLWKLSNVLVSHWMGDQKIIFSGYSSASEGMIGIRKACALAVWILIG